MASSTKAFTVAMMIEAIDKSSATLKKVSQGLTGITKQADTFAERWTRATQRMEQRASKLKSHLSGALKMGAFAAGIFKVGNDYEEMMGNIATMTDLGLNAFKKKYEKTFFDISKQTGTSLKEIGAAAWQALSREVPENKIAKFLQDINKAAIAGKDTMENMVSSVLPTMKTYNIEVVKASVVANKFAVAMRVGAFTSEEIATQMATVSSNAKGVGVPMEELLGIFSAVSQVMGKSKLPELTTGMRAFIVASKRAGGQYLIDFNKNLERTGKTAINWNSDLIRKNGLIGAVENLKAQVKGATNSTVEYDQVLTRLLPKKAMSFFEKTALMADRAAINTLKVAKATNEVDKMAKKQMAARSFKIMTAQLKIMTIQISKALIPVVKELFSVLKPVIESIAEWAKNNKEAVKWIAKIIIGIAALKLGLVALGFLMGPMVWLMKGLAFQIKGMSIATWLWTTAQKALNFVMSINPIAAMAYAIAGLIAVGVLLYQNWEKVGQVADAILFPIFDGIAKSIDYLVGKAIAAWKTVKNLVSGPSIDFDKVREIKADADARDKFKSGGMSPEEFNKLSPRTKKSISSMDEFKSNKNTGGGGMVDKSVNTYKTNINIGGTNASPEEITAAVAKGTNEASLREHDRKNKVLKHQKKNRKM